MSMRELVALALNQTVMWERKIDVNSYGEPIYDTPIEIACRVAVKHRLVRNKQGQEVTSGAQLTVLAPVSRDDRITIGVDKFIVIDVTVPVTFAGTEHRRKVFI
jgi:hypothetical protein